MPRRGRQNLRFKLLARLRTRKSATRWKGREMQILHFLPLFLLTGCARCDNLSVDDISATVITAVEERGIHMGTTALTEAVFYILLSLDTPLHGYGIMQNVESLSGGRVRLAAGTLYGALATLTERGWIVSLGDESEGRKKEYQITPAGREAVRAELRRLHELTQNGDKLTSEWN